MLLDLRSLLRLDLAIVRSQRAPVKSSRRESKERRWGCSTFSHTRSRIAKRDLMTLMRSVGFWKRNEFRFRKRDTKMTT